MDFIITLQILHLTTHTQSGIFDTDREMSNFFFYKDVLDCETAEYEYIPKFLRIVHLRGQRSGHEEHRAVPSGLEAGVSV